MAQALSPSWQKNPSKARALAMEPLPIWVPALNDDPPDEAEQVADAVVDRVEAVIDAGGGIIHLIELVNYAAEVAERAPLLDEFGKKVFNILGLALDVVDLWIEIDQAKEAIDQSGGDRGEVFAQIYNIFFEFNFFALKALARDFLTKATAEAGHTIWSQLKEPAMDQIRFMFGENNNNNVAVVDESQILADLGIGDASISADSIYKSMLLGGRSVNNFSGGQAGDIVIGGPGNDHLYGGGGDDRLSAGAGEDYIEAGSGSDWIDGGGHVDRALLDLSDETVAVEFSSVAVASSQGQTLVDGTHVRNVEWITLYTGSGDDEIALRGFDFQGSQQYVSTGSGDDTLRYTTLVGGAYWSAGDGIDRLIVDLAYETNAINMGTYNGVPWRLFNASDSNHSINFGEVERLTLFTGSGNDTLLGLNGDDRFTANAGNDHLYGGAGGDWVNGGRGKDVMSGGAGTDRFYFENGHSAASASRADLITDFRQSDRDRIDLRGIDADTGLAGVQRFRFIGSDAFSSASGELRYRVYEGQTLVEGDTDGDGVKDFTISLTGDIALLQADFLI